MRTQSNNMYYGMSTNKRRSRDASVNGGDTVEIHARAIYLIVGADGHLILKIRADLCAICRWSRFPGRLRTWQIGHNTGRPKTKDRRRTILQADPPRHSIQRMAVSPVVNHHHVHSAIITFLHESSFLGLLEIFVGKYRRQREGGIFVRSDAADSA